MGRLSPRHGTIPCYRIVYLAAHTNKANRDRHKGSAMHRYLKAQLWAEGATYEAAIKAEDNMIANLYKCALVEFGIISVKVLKTMHVDGDILWDFLRDRCGGDL